MLRESQTAFYSGLCHHARQLVCEYTLLKFPKLSVHRCWRIVRSIFIEYQQTLTAAHLSDVIRTKLKTEASMAHQTEVSPVTELLITDLSLGSFVV